MHYISQFKLVWPKNEVLVHRFPFFNQSALRSFTHGFVFRSSNVCPMSKWQKWVTLQVFRRQRRFYPRQQHLNGPGAEWRPQNEPTRVAQWPSEYSSDPFYYMNSSFRKSTNLYGSLWYSKVASRGYLIHELQKLLELVLCQLMQ